MKFSISKSKTGLVAAAAVLATAQQAAAHTWVEQARVIAPNGTMIGDLGYQRAFVARNDPRFTGDINLLRSNATIGKNDRMCRSGAAGAYADPKFPRLKVAPGSFIALQYLENGHVTEPYIQPTKPANRGTVFVYGTTQPRDDDTILGVHLQWNADGTGGDRRGKLLATRNFDDGQCYEANDSPISQQRQAQFKKPTEQPMGNSLWCQTDLQLPKDIPSNGTYTLYWVWDWPLLDGKKIDINSTANGDFPSGNLAGKDPRVIKAETYTSCLELDVMPPVKGGAFLELATAPRQFKTGQDLTFAAVQDQLKDNFLVPLFGGNGSSTGTLPDNSLQPQPTATGSGAGSDSGVVTVVVTASPVTVTNFVTVFKNGNSLSTAAPNSPTSQASQTSSATSSASRPKRTGSSPAQASGLPQVSPFLKARRRYRRV